MKYLSSFLAGKHKLEILLLLLKKLSCSDCQSNSEESFTDAASPLSRSECSPTLRLDWGRIERNFECLQWLIIGTLAKLRFKIDGYITAVSEGPPSCLKKRERFTSRAPKPER